MGTNYYFVGNHEPRIHLGKLRDGNRPFMATMTPRVMKLIYQLGRFLLVDEYHFTFGGTSNKVYTLEEFSAILFQHGDPVDVSDRSFGTMNDDYW